MRKKTPAKKAPPKRIGTLRKPRFITKMYNGKKMTIIDFGVPDAGSPAAVKRAMEFAKKHPMDFEWAE